MPASQTADRARCVICSFPGLPPPTPQRIISQSDVLAKCQDKGSETLSWCILWSIPISSANTPPHPLTPSFPEPDWFSHDGSCVLTLRGQYKERSCHLLKCLLLTLRWVIFMELHLQRCLVKVALSSVIRLNSTSAVLICKAPAACIPSAKEILRWFLASRQLKAVLQQGCYQHKSPLTEEKGLWGERSEHKQAEFGNPPASPQSAKS